MSEVTPLTAELKELQDYAKEISAAIPNITVTTVQGKLYVGLRVFPINGTTEQERINDIVDHLKYVAIGIKWVIGEAPNLNKLEFTRKPIHETKQKETTLLFQRSACSCCHSDPHTFSLVTPAETRQEDVELELMMSAFKHMLTE